MGNKDAAQEQLQKRMLGLAQAALLDDSVHILAVVLEDRREVLLNGDGMVETGPRRHADSFLRFPYFF